MPAGKGQLLHFGHPSRMARACGELDQDFEDDAEGDRSFTLAAGWPDVRHAGRRR